MFAIDLELRNEEMLSLFSRPPYSLSLASLFILSPVPLVSYLIESIQNRMF